MSAAAPVTIQAISDGIRPTATARGAAARQVSEALARRLGPHKFDMWFGHAHLRVEGTRLDVATDSPFVARWIDSHFADDLRSVAIDALGESAQINVHVDESSARADDHSRTDARTEGGSSRGREQSSRDDADFDAESARRSDSRPGVDQQGRPSRRAARPPRGDRAILLRRLEDFVVGESNRLAFAAACRVADSDDGHGLSVLFVHGECGVGKTHLLQGICRRWSERTGRPASVRYATGEQFTNEFIAAVRTNTLDTFRARMRKLDLLAIDDVHFLSNKVRTQSEFLYTLDAIGLGGARIVMASDDHPRHIKRFNQALVSRFISGMVVKVERPDRCTRLELIRRLASVRSLSLNDAAVDTIAGQCVGSVRELEGAITRLAAVTTLLHEPGSNGDNGTNGGENNHLMTGPGGSIGAVLAQHVIGDHVNGGVGTHIKLHGLIGVVCEKMNVSMSDLTGSGRHRRVVLARAMVAYLSRELTTHSYPEIAQALGREYHSTVHTADQRLRKQLEHNEPLDPRTAGPHASLRELVDQVRYEVVKSASRPG